VLHAEQLRDLQLCSNHAQQVAEKKHHTACFGHVASCHAETIVLHTLMGLQQQLRSYVAL
jgi:hypothetical protein